MDNSRYILLLDSSTEYCSVALASNTQGVISYLEEEDRSRQSERLAVMADEVIADKKISAVCVAEGPGSYTGLRIEAGYAKGLAWAQGIPILATSTLQLLCRSFLSKVKDLEEGALFLPMIDARRMEVYTALYDCVGNAESDISALVLTDPDIQNRIKARVGNRSLYFFGSGAEKAVELFSTLIPTAHYVGGIYPQAKDMAEDAFKLLDNEDYCDVAYWEPFYLKEYEAKLSPNKVLAKLGTNKIDD